MFFGGKMYRKDFEGAAQEIGTKGEVKAVPGDGFRIDDNVLWIRIIRSGLLSKMQPFTGTLLPTPDNDGYTEAILISMFGISSTQGLRIDEDNYLAYISTELMVYTLKVKDKFLAVYVGQELQALFWVPSLEA